jgi:hypothetical protein
MVILDSSNGRAIGTVPIGAAPDDAAFDPETRLIFTSNGDGTVSVTQQESPDKYGVLETIKTAPGAPSRIKYSFRYSIAALRPAAHLCPVRFAFLSTGRENQDAALIPKHIASSISRKGTASLSL